MTIGDSIRALRKSRGLTQKELAQKLGVSASMIGQYETNVRKPKLATLENIATSLGAEITELVDINRISPSLSAAMPLISKVGYIFDRAKPGAPAILSDDEKIQIAEIANLIGNIPDEISHSSFLINILRKELLSLFDKLDMRGKTWAIKILSDLVYQSELESTQDK